MRVPGIPYVQGRNDYDDGDGRKFGIAIHNTSNDASDEGEASYAQRRTDGISSHFYADRDSVTQSLDTRDRAGHAGSRHGNENAIAVEITGSNAKSRAWWIENVAWDKLARVLAIVCKEYGIEPRRASVAEMKANPKVRAFYGHDDMRRAWGGTTHTDPGPNFPWDHLLSKVRQAMTGEADDDMTPEQEAKLDAVAADVRKVLTMNLTRRPDGSPENALAWWIRTLANAQDETLRRTYGGPVPGVSSGLAQISALVSRDMVDEPAVIAGVLKGLTPDMFAQAMKLAGLTPERIADVIPAELAQDVADELGRRLAPTEQ